jgi:hypothetical protein
MAKFWSNVDIDIQTALGSSQDISGLTAANPGVVTYVGSDPTNNQIITISAVGMTEVHQRAFAVKNVNGGANTFDIGENTTGYHTFTSGSFTPVTLGASMSTVQGVTASGGEPEFADITTVHDQVRRRVPTVVSPFQIQFECLWDPSDAAHVELGLASRTITTRVVKITFSDGSFMVGNAYISAANVPNGNAQDAVKTGITFSFDGLPTVYAS